MNITPSKIESCEAVSFRLEVPLREFEDLPHRLSSTIERAPQTIKISVAHSNCFLKFRVAGDVAVLCEVYLRDDSRGFFFQQVLGSLLIEYHGDFHGFLTWNNPKGRHVEILVEKGNTDHPLLASLKSGQRRSHFEPRENADEMKVRDYLKDASEAWAEYQHQKARREKTLRENIGT